MNFKQAYEEMLKGEKVRRPDFVNPWYIEQDKILTKLESGEVVEVPFNTGTIIHMNSDDWEVVKESKIWEPKEKELYFYYDSEGLIYESVYSGGSIDKNRLDLGNCFRTREQARHMVEKLKVIKELRDFALENNKAEIDWKNKQQEKNIIVFVYDYEFQTVKTGLWYHTQYIPFNICFTSKEIAQKAIATIGEDRIKKYYFDVEEE